MNVIWRTLLVILRAKVLVRRNGRIPANSVGRVRLRTLPTDIDLLLHMNNGRYASLFDLGRFDLMIRTGLWDVMAARKWHAVVASETVTFRKSLNLWQRFTVESRLVGHDERSFYLMHRAVVDGEVYAEMIIRARFLTNDRRAVPHEEFFAAVGSPDTLAPLPEWVTEWARGSALPNRRTPAPSIWA